MTTITIERKLLEQAFGQLRCNTSNLQKGMSKSIQKLCARENAEVLEILHAALAAPATAPDRHAQELLAQDITLQNMRERHAQELCAYEVTVDKLRAERKPMTDDETLDLFDRVKVGMLFTDAEAAPFASGVAAAEHFHGIGEKP